MPEKIVKRSGDPEKRQQSGKVLAQVGTLKQEYILCNQQLEKCEDQFDFEKKKTANVKSALDEATSGLSQIQEEIDSDPLPEGAQPKARIQRRDVLQLVSREKILLTVYYYGPLFQSALLHLIWNISSSTT